MARQRTLTPLIGVRIPVPQPENVKGLAATGCKPFLFSFLCELNDPSFSFVPTAASATLPTLRWRGVFGPLCEHGRT